MNSHTGPRVVIIGAGFGGLWAARHLARAPAQVLLLDRNNYHTFLPLLYQVAAAELEPRDIVYPVRSILRRAPNADFCLAEVKEIDFDARVVKTTERVIPYDFLALGTGSTSHFFGVPGAAEHAFLLKTLDEGDTRIQLEEGTDGTDTAIMIFSKSASGGLQIQELRALGSNLVSASFNYYEVCSSALLSVGIYSTISFPRNIPIWH